MTIELQKLIMNYVVRNENLEEYKRHANYFDNKDINNIFSAIVYFYNSEGILVLDSMTIMTYLNNKEINIGLNVINSSLILVEYDEDWLRKEIEKWKKEIFARMTAISFIDDIKNKNYDDLYEVYKSKNLMDRLDELEDEEDKDSDILNTPYIDKGVYEIMPKLLSNIFNNLEVDREKDVVLTSSMCVLSILFDDVYMYWGDEMDRCNLYSFIGARASSGKGKMIHSKELLTEYIKREKTINEGKKLEVEKHNSNLEKGKGEKMIYKQKTTIIPGNSSAAAFREKLENNGGKGLIFVTEVDDIIGGKSQEWGNYDGMLRNSFHNEDISSNRKGEDVVNIEKPFISCVMSGTFDQVISMFEGKSENGLFSRFIFYVFISEDKWKRDNGNSILRKSVGNFDLSTIFRNYSLEINRIYEFFRGKHIEISLNIDQINYIDNVMEKLYLRYTTIYGSEVGSTIKRMAVIARKLIMVFSMFRFYENKDLVGYNELLFNFNNNAFIIDADDNDVYNSISMIKTYIKHNLLIFNSFQYNNVKKKPTIIVSDKNDSLLSEVGNTFTYNEMLELGKKYNIHQKAVQRFLKKSVNKGLISRTKKGEYTKL